MNGVVFKEAVSALVNKTQVRKIGSEKVDIYDSLKEIESTKTMEEAEISGAPEASEALEASGSSEANEAPATPEINPDPVDPKLFPHVILLHYYLGDTEYFRVLTKEQFADMIPGMIYVKTRYKCFYTGGNHEW